MDHVVVRRSLTGGEICPGRAPGDPAPAHEVSIIICTRERAASLGRFLDSLARQDLRPARLVIVDASSDDGTERMLAERGDPASWGRDVWYFRIDGPLRGLTRQRNFGLRWVCSDLVAFFDDDIVLSPGCLGVMENVHRLIGEGLVGVGARMDGGKGPSHRLWRVRCALRVVASLKPGTYQRSGMSIPWSFLGSSEAVTDGDYLPGGATMWRTDVIRDLGFNEAFAGYGQGEDLEFSLRARKKGRLVLAPAARLRHLHEDGGRPDNFRLGYMAIHNRYLIHRDGLENRSWRDVTWFVYAWGIDTLMMLRHIVIPSRSVSVVQQLGGRLKAVLDLVRGK
jgi:GT2 family glycosyltransferase